MRWASLRGRVATAIVVTTLVTSSAAHADPKAEGDAAMDAGRAAEALAAYERARALEPERVELLYNIGRARLAIGDFAGALDFFEEFAQKAPDDLKKKTHRLGEVMTELRAKVGTLDVTGDVEATDATVTWGGKALGSLPLHARVNAGRAELRVERPGFEPWARTIDLVGGQTLVVQPVLVRAKPPEPIVTRLGIATSPSGAGVTVDGMARGTAPMEIDVSPGEHRVVVSAPKHQSRALTLTLASGETRRIDMQLREDSPPVTSRWWFWTGIGVVATGLAVGIVAATVERSPSEGSLGTFRAP
ncbi:MAG: PEGA domain-containing protein [Deltaproteobacteria bacterium]|nr:PEGA domain-containing protein [Deltaproteobacteria bacterium]